MIKKLFIGAVALIIIGAIGVGITWKSYKDDFEEVTQTKTIENEQINIIQIDADLSKVIVKKGTGSAIQIDANGVNTRDYQYHFEVKEEGNSLIVISKHEQKNYFFNFGISFYTHKERSVIITLPEKQYDELKVQNNIEDIEITNLAVNKVNLKTDTGNIKAENLGTNNIILKTNIGDVFIKNVSGAKDVSTDTGNISIDEPTLLYDMKLSSAIGDILISTKEPTDASFQTKTDIGDISIFDKWDKNAVIGNGKPVINAKTNTGNITIGN